MEKWAFGELFKEEKIKHILLIQFTAKAKLAHSIGINPSGFQKTTA